MGKTTLPERARFARERVGLSPQAAADLIGCSRPLIYRWEKDADSIGGAHLLKAATVYRVRPGWLQTGEGKDEFPWHDASPVALTNEGAWTDVRGYAQAVGLGDSAEASEYEVAHALKFRRDSLARKRLSAQKLAVVYGKGDSMLPRIKSGDAVLFDTSDVRPANDAIFVIRIDGFANAEYNVKRCVIVDDLVLFAADNPSGDHHWRTPRRMDSKRHPITIMGRVRWIGSWED